MGKTKHINHIVPQFYLKQWANLEGKLNCIDIFHIKRSMDSIQCKQLETGGVGYIKDTYSDELEDAFAKYEDIIAKKYPTIIEKLENAEWKQSLRSGRRVLTGEEEYLLMLFYYLQSRRTLSGRIRFSKEEYHNMSIMDAGYLAEKQEKILLNDLKAITKEKVYRDIKDSYWIVFRIPNHYSFWTSTNPVHYGVFNELFNPLQEHILKPGFDRMDCSLLPLSPRLTLCFTIKSRIEPNPVLIPAFRKNFLTIFPLDTKYSGISWKENSIEILKAFHAGLLQGYEAQYGISENDKKLSKYIDGRNAQFWLILGNKCTKSELDFLTGLSINHPDKKHSVNNYFSQDI